MLVTKPSSTISSETGEMTSRF